MRSFQLKEETSAAVVTKESISHRVVKSNIRCFDRLFDCNGRNQKLQRTNHHDNSCFISSDVQFVLMCNNASQWRELKTSKLAVSFVLKSYHIFHVRSTVFMQEVRAFLQNFFQFFEVLRQIETVAKSFCVDSVHLWKSFSADQQQSAHLHG